MAFRTYLDIEHKINQSERWYRPRRRKSWFLQLLKSAAILLVFVGFFATLFVAFGL